MSRQLPGQVASVAPRAIAGRVDVSAVAPPGCRTIAFALFVPTGLSAGARVPVVFCFPGGGMSRRYFDLPVAGYSQAAALAADGYLAVLIDHPGVGDSDVPDDPWLLDPATVADVDVHAARGILALLRAGALDGLVALQPGPVFAIGHSAGALLLIHQQARHADYDAIALLGWSGDGLPQHLDDAERSLIGGSDGFMQSVTEAARRRFGEPLPALPRGSSPPLTDSPAAADVQQALAAARSPLLAVVGEASLIPGGAASAAARITVPIFLGVGERDIATGYRTAAAGFISSPGVTTFVLEDAGHNHNVEPTRQVLWDRLVRWMNVVEVDRATSTVT
jgi:pimeloyl-ACP methyl ester carboxylesterase